jgi:hypothetical protein
MSLFVVLVLTFLLAVAPPLTYAKTIYVRPSEDGGDDSRSCGQARQASSPRSTLNGGIKCLDGGDTLVAAGGTYTETVAMPGGTTLRAAPDLASAVLVLKGNDTTIEGITVDGKSLYGITVDLDLGQRNVLRNVEITGAFSQAVVGAPRNGQFIGVHLHHSGQYCHPEYAPGLKDNYCPSHGYHHGFYLGGGGSGNVIDGCYIHDIPDGLGMQLYSDGTTVKNCLIVNTGAHGIFALGSDTLIYNTVFVNTGMGPYDDNANPADAYGAGVFVTGSNTRLFHNTFYTPSPIRYQAGVYSRPGDVILRNNLLLSVADTAARFVVMENGGGTLQNNLCTLQNNLCTLQANGCTVVEANVGRVLRDAVGGDYRLSDTSPAVGAGSVLGEVDVDKDSKPRSRSGRVALGAYEPGGPQRPTAVPAPVNLRVTAQ